MKILFGVFLVAVFAQQQQTTVQQQPQGQQVSQQQPGRIVNKTIITPPSSQQQTQQQQPQQQQTQQKGNFSTLKPYVSKDNATIQNTTVLNFTDHFFQDVKKWALDEKTVECKELMTKWFDTFTVVQAAGLPTSFSLLGNNTAVCKLLKHTIKPKSITWQNDFVNDLTLSAMGSFWINGDSVDKTVKLPENLEFVYNIQFDPVTNKLFLLEIIPLEPDLIYQAVASKPIKSFHHFMRTAMKEGFTSPGFSKLLSDKFQLLVPNLFVGNPGFKTRFTKEQLKDFLTQDIQVFDLDKANLAGFSIPYHDEKTVVAEVRFDELPIKRNGIRLQDIKFWLVHTFDCDQVQGKGGAEKQSNVSGEKELVNITQVPGRKLLQGVEGKSSQGQKSDLKSNETDVEGETDTDFCVLDKLIMIVNRPINMITRIVPFDNPEQQKEQKSGMESGQGEVKSVVKNETKQ